MSLELPRNLLASLLLHCQETNVTSTTSKSWQIVKKVWALLAGLELTGQQLILGLASPVPTEQASSSPLLDREAQSPLFPGLARPQWAALVQFASRAVSQVRTDWEILIFQFSVFSLSDCRDIPAHYYQAGGAL